MAGEGTLREPCSEGAPACVQWSRACVRGTATRGLPPGVCDGDGPLRPGQLTAGTWPRPGDNAGNPQPLWAYPATAGPLGGAEPGRCVTEQRRTVIEARHRVRIAASCNGRAGAGAGQIAVHGAPSAAAPTPGWAPGRAPYGRPTEPVRTPPGDLPIRSHHEGRANRPGMADGARQPGLRLDHVAMVSEPGAATPPAS
jgi:hypothetical protein